jgi:hypothetical protein
VDWKVGGTLKLSLKCDSSVVFASTVWKNLEKAEFLARKPSIFNKIKGKRVCLKTNDPLLLMSEV